MKRYGCLSASFIRGKQLTEAELIWVHTIVKRGFIDFSTCYSSNSLLTLKFLLKAGQRANTCIAKVTRANECQDEWRRDARQTEANNPVFSDNTPDTLLIERKKNTSISKHKNF